MTMTGRCLCGAVTFTAEGVKTDHHACHCANCRRWGGPALAAEVESAAFETDAAITVFASSGWAERGFCARCGTHLFYRLKESGQTLIWVGAFDDPAAFSLSGEIFIDKKPEGYAMAGEHPRMTEKEFLAMIGIG